MRVDRSTSASDPDGSGDIKFAAMGAAFTPPIRKRRCIGTARYDVGRLYDQGHIYADEAERAHQLLRSGVRRQRSRRFGSKLPLFRGSAGWAVADQEPQRSRIAGCLLGYGGGRRRAEPWRRPTASTASALIICLRFGWMGSGRRSSGESLFQFFEGHADIAARRNLAGVRVVLRFIGAQHHLFVADGFAASGNTELFSNFDVSP
jgi:hypothetical protein